MLMTLARPIELKDLTRFVSAIDPQLSPDFAKIAFVVIRPDEKRDNYDSTIWMIDRISGKPFMYFGGGSGLWPRWSPDGKHLLFLSKKTMKEGEKGNELWVASIGGGEPRLVLRLKGGVEAPYWMPDGNRIIFLSAVGEEEEGVRVVRRIPLWSNGAGFTYHARKHLHIVDVNSGSVRQLTKGDMSVVYASPSNRGSKIAYVASTNDLSPMTTDLFVMDVDSGESKKLTGSNMSIGAVCWSPDDRQLAFKGHNLRRGFATHVTIWLIPAEGGPPLDLTGKLDRGSSRNVYYDLRGPVTYLLAPVPGWSQDYIYFTVSDRGRYNLHRINAKSGNIESVITGDFLVDDFSVRGNVVAYLKVTKTTPAEMWVKDERGDRKLTNLNDSLLTELKLPAPEHFEYQSSDGKKIDGWVMRPRIVGEDQKAPAILDIHGGPKSVFGYSFMFEHHFFSSNGFAVIYLNPRGSDGYSEEFADIRGAYGERDLKDIMEGLDHALSRFSFIDPDRLGVTGLSYGGFMTNWIVTHTDRFRAAVSQNSISDWTAMFGTTDIGFYFSPDQIGNEPWSNPQGYLNKSPLTYAPKVTTPTMFIHSSEDFRCWIDQSITFFTALKYLGKETELVLFDKGEHTFRSTSKPSFRMKRLEHMLRWFRQHLTSNK